MLTRLRFGLFAITALVFVTGLLFFASGPEHADMPSETGALAAESPDASVIDQILVLAPDMTKEQVIAELEALLREVEEESLPGMRPTLDEVAEAALRELQESARRTQELGSHP